MSIEQVNEVDVIGIDKESDEVVLSIIDSLDWSDEIRHLSLLQEKLNTYLRFIEGDEIYRSYPDAKGMNIVVKIFAKHKLTENADLFIGKASSAIEKAGFTLIHIVTRQNSIRAEIG